MEKYNKIAVSKTDKIWSQLVISGTLAGFFIGLGGLCSQMVTAEGMPKALSALVFSVGLIMVVLSGSELFTGNCMMFSAVCTGAVRIKDVIRNWFYVYLGNLLGSVILAISVNLMKLPSMFNGKLEEIMLSAYSAKLDQSMGMLVMKAVFCNILVCMAVWYAIHSENTISKIMSCAIPVFVFVYCGFEHCVANMYFLPAAAFTYKTVMTPWILIIWQILVVTAGNVLGGIIISLFLYVITFRYDKRDVSEYKCESRHDREAGKEIPEIGPTEMSSIGYLEHERLWEGMK